MVRNSAVLVSGALCRSFAARAAQGERFSFIRLRITSVIVPVVIAVLIVLPGAFPLWMKVEQALCGLCILAVAILVNRPALRAAFARS
jgi:hypothetical protein